MADLQITSHLADDHCRLQLCGEVDISNVAHLRTQLLSALEQRPQLQLDLAAVVSMDSSGIATLLELREQADDAARSLRILAVGDRVRTALELLQLDGLLLGD